MLPAAFGLYLARRAIRNGDGRARVPMTVAIVVAAGYVVLNGVSALAIWLS